MTRQWTDDEKQLLGRWVSGVPWLQAHFSHNLAVIPRFFESRPEMPITPETLTLAVQSSELLPDPYRPNALDRLRVGETPQPQAPRPWSPAPASRQAPESEKPSKLSNNAL